MLNDDFYPTPKEIALKMIEGIPNLSALYILEPSAGKGDLLDALEEKYKNGYYSNTSKHLKSYCIEKDEELVLTLKGKGYQVISNDFLTFKPSHIFNLILMNPPFSNGVEHLLHAWDILEDGQIVCLLNEESVKNCFSSNRKLLKDIIDEHGSIEYLGSVFEDAERTTDVRVVMVRLFKKGDFGRFGFEEKTKEKSYESGINDESNHEYEVAVFEQDNLSAMVDAYEASKRLFVDIWKLRKQIEKYLEYCGGLSTSKENFLEHALQKKDPIEGYNLFVDESRLAFWNSLFEKTKFQAKMTERVKKEFDNFRQTHGFDFTAENISSILDMLVHSSKDIKTQCILDCFDLFTKYHDENRIYPEGWVTNSGWLANRKIILPRMVEVQWSGRGFRSSYYHYNELNDIDKAMCFLTGKNFEKIMRIEQAIPLAQETESEFFYLKSHKKGTLHLTFKDESLWKRFNIAACDGKNWLPNDKGKKPRKQRKKA